MGSKTGLNLSSSQLCARSGSCYCTERNNKSNRLLLSQFDILKYVLGRQNDKVLVHLD